MSQLRIFIIGCCLCLTATTQLVVLADEHKSPDNAGTAMHGKSPEPASVDNNLLISSTDQSVNSQRYKQRQLYQETINAIRMGSRRKAELLKKELLGYPLLPYVELEQIKVSLRRAKPETIQRFIDTHIDSPIGEQLRSQFLNQRMARNRWQDYLALYRKESATTEQHCYHVDAVWQSGRQQEANELAIALWLSERSMPKQCDPVFSRLRRANGISQELAWQRFELALVANETVLARYLMRFLNTETSQTAQQLYELYRNPRRLTGRARYDFRDPMQHKILSATFEKLARINPENALKELNSYRQQGALTQTLAEDLYALVGLYLARKGKMTETLKQLPLALRAHPKLVEARARFAIQNEDWGETLVLLNLLPEQHKDKPVWKYWRAISLLSNSEPSEQALARSILEDLSLLRDYYGFLAAARLDRPQQLQEEIKPISSDSVENLLATPATARIRELIALGAIIQARREWFHMTQDFSTREHQITAVIARRWRWHDMAIRAYAQAKAWNELAGRFPLAYPEHFSSNALLSGIPLSLSLAVARKESAFWPDARSTVGALGLMQLMPATGKLAAKHFGIRAEKGIDLTDPVLNIRLGSWYLGELVRRFDNNRIIALAAYNAGPTRVSRWLNRALPIDIWIESIPYWETRDYVQTTLVYAAIYADRLGHKQPMIAPSERAQFGPVRQFVFSDTNEVESASTNGQL